MDIDELSRAHSALVERTRNLRADLSAMGLLMDALLMGMTSEQRDALEARFDDMSERFIAHGLRHSQDPTDKSLEVIEQAVHRMRQRLRAVPRD